MQSDNTRGALLMMAAMAAFTLNDALMKVLFAEMSMYQAMFLRGALGSVVLFGVARHFGAFRTPLRGRDRRLMGVRLLAEGAASWFFLSALWSMPLANLTAILQSLPLIITLAGALFLGERVGWRRLVAIAVGFVGVLLIVRPTGDGFGLHAIYALCSVVCVTLRDLTTRRMSPSAPSMAVAFYTTLGIGAFGGVGMLGETWTAPSAAAWAVLVATSLMVVIGYLASVMAMRVGELAIVTPFRYMGLLWALLLGWVVFGDWPDGLTLIGAALIVVTGLFTLYRQQVLARRARAQVLR